MPEQIGDRLDMHTGLEPVHGGAVPKCVDADALDACGLGGALHDAQQIARVDRPAQLGGEHQTRIGPLVTGTQSLGLLLGAVSAQHHDHRRRQRHGTTGTVGLKT